MRELQKKLKRTAALLLAAMLVVNAVELPVLTVYAAESCEEEQIPQTVPEVPSTKTASGSGLKTDTASGSALVSDTNTASGASLTILGFAALKEDISEQELPVGASEEEIIFPEVLVVVVSDTESVPASVKRITLTDITWELNTVESDGEVFDSSEECDGYCYVYTPVLPETDEEGNIFALGENVDIPVIYVLIGAGEDYVSLTEVSAETKALMLGTSGIKSPTAVTNDSGTYYAPNSYIYFGMNSGNGSTPIKWRVLDADKTNDGMTDGVFLLSEYTMGVTQFDSSESVYQGSDAQRWCNSFASNSSNFSLAEQGVMLGVTKTDPAETVYWYKEGESNLTAADKMFFLSSREASDYVASYQGEMLKTTNTAQEAKIWWLRTPEDDKYVSGVSARGMLNPYGVKGGSDIEARPACNLTLESVLFTSAAEGGKSDGIGTISAIDDYSGNEWKLTLLDSSRNFSVSDKSAITVNTKTAISLAYTGATTGEYISVMIADDSGAKYYGKVAQATGEAGTVSILLPTNLADGTYNLHVFSEQCNGDKKTDYASAFQTMMLTVDNTAPTLTAGTATRTSKTDATLTFTSSETGSYYYDVVDSDAAIPAIDTAGEGTVCAEGSNTISLTGLTDENAKVIYIVVRDTAGNESDKLKIEIPLFPIPSIKVDKTEVTLANLSYGYTETEAQANQHTVTITNTGNVALTLKQPTATNYEIGTLSKNMLSPNESAEFTITPKFNLAAGDYEETITVGDTEGKVNIDVSLTIKVKKATPDVGMVTVNTLENSVNLEDVQLSRSDETLAGTLALKEGTVLSYGTHDYTWVFTPTDSDNYAVIEGTVSIDIKDTIAPAAEYKIGTDGWKKFVNTISFGLFCKDYKTFEIQYTDNESGIAKKQYYISEAELSEDEITKLTTDGKWKDYTGKISLDAAGTYFVYVKAEDSYGNVSVLNSEGIVIYEESVFAVTDLTYTYKDNTDLTAEINLNGNTFVRLTDENKATVNSGNYSFDSTDGLLTLKKEYLDTLAAGEYTYHAVFYPQGVDVETSAQTEYLLTYEFTLSVEKREVTVSEATAAIQSKTYDGSKIVEITSVVLNNVIAGEEVFVDCTYLKGTLAGADADTYDKVTLPELTITGAEAKNYKLVQPQNAVELTGNVIIKKAEAQITVSESYDAVYGDNAFAIDAKHGNTDEAAKLVYSVSDSRDSFGNPVDNDGIICVDTNGMLTLKGAGSAVVTITLAETTNYTSAESKKVTVTVQKASSDTYGMTFDKKYCYINSYTENIDLTGYLPKDCGSIVYGTPEITYLSGNASLFSQSPKFDTENAGEGVLTYGVAAQKSYAADQTASIKVKVSTNNYEDIIFTINVIQTEQKTVEPKTDVTLKNNVLTYGETLSELKFNEAVFVSKDDPAVEISGILAWSIPDEAPVAGTLTAQWTFTPDNKYNREYASVTGNANITVNKAAPNIVTAPTVDMTYNPGTKLSDIDLNPAGTNKTTGIIVTAGSVTNVDGNALPGTWSWQTSSQVPQVNNNGYQATFTPTDMANYATVTRTITVTVAKATPYIDGTPTASGLTYGQTLANSTVQGAVYYDSTKNTPVTGYFGWENENIRPTAKTDSDNTLYEVIFKPSDDTNYNEVSAWITITVDKAQNAPNMPGSTRSVTFGCKTVGAASLPEGWIWDTYRDGDETTDRTTDLEVGIPIKAAAVYNGADKGNYINESVVITITRSDCDHVAGEILYTGTGEHAPDCENTGLGHRECTKCQEVMESGIVVAALGHQGGTATCTKKAVCTVCQQEYGSTNPDNHEGETELRGYAAPTLTKEGYTGDTWCMACETMLERGSIIPKLTPPRPTSAPRPTVTAIPTTTPMPDVTAAPTPTSTPDATAVPTPTSAPDATVAPTPTSAPDATASPAPTYQPEKEWVAKDTFRKQEETYEVLLGTSLQNASMVQVANVGETIDLNFYGVKNWKKEAYTYQWISSDETVATVDKLGNVTMRKEGIVKITLELTEKATGRKLSAAPAFVGVPEKVYGVFLGTSLSDAKILWTLEPGKQIDLNFYGVKNWKGEDYTYRWTSSDEDIATVDYKGLVTAKKSGIVIISLELKKKSTGEYLKVAPAVMVIPEEEAQQ